MKDKILDQYNQILERLELKVKDDGTIESVEKNGYIKKFKYENKNFVSLYKDGIQYRRDDIPLIINCAFSSFSFQAIREHISYLIYFKTFKLLVTLLEYWKNNNFNKEKLNSLIYMLNELYENNLDQIASEGLSQKLVQLKSIIEEHNVFDFIIKFNCIISLERFDEEALEKKGLNQRNADENNYLYVYKQNNIQLIYPFYGLIKDTKEEKILGIVFENREIEALKTILEFIFDNIDEKYKSSREKYGNKKLILLQNFTFENDGYRLIKKYINIVNKMNEITVILEDSNIADTCNSDSIEEDFYHKIENVYDSYTMSCDGRDEISKNYYRFSSNIQTLNKELNEKSVVENDISKKINSKERKVKNFNYSYSRSSRASLPFFSNTIISPDISNSISKPICLDSTLESFNTYVPLKERLRHTYILAGSGSGKTSLLEYLFYQDIQNKQCSKIFFDIMGKSTKKIMQFVDKKDLLLLDFTLKEGFTFKINPFNLKSRKNKKISKKDIAFRTKVIINAFEKVLGIEWSHNMKVVLVPCIATLLRKKNSNIFELQRLIQGEKELVDLGKKSPNKWHREFFETQFDDEKLDVTKDAITTKLQALLNEDETFLNMVMGEDTIDLEEAINTKGKTIIIKLPKEANLLARLIVEMIQEIVKKRVVDYPENEIIDTHIYFDEFQNYVTETLEEILAESRNYKLYVTFAHQTLRQIGDKLEDMVLSCTNIKLIGQNSHKNLIKMSKEIQVDIKQLEALKQGEFFLKVGSNEAIKIKTTDKFINMKIDEEKYQEHITYQLENYYTKIEDENIIEAVMDDSKPLAPTKSF
ncbi:type IV secretory system conjugative DNA transfer family protein [Aliarcobacter butzleri]|uniref:Type IV secretion system DNA-binding domain-containing protein n=1 Tax=Aliarcobacter butzleri TaxID=28197 RepID=A0AAW6VUF5_9BACT|nr:type IV secretion system DNA-binding domain-containing protein [Aliarcobacter butzleri]MCT7639826.1 type IV secretion system DNA-binding domain-containing protein [Aliarcobacter butzleri]MDK2063208.1 type IV secretion system DNA-binding domain-containing protein [Aliarcobacter butzleri]